MTMSSRIPLMAATSSLSVSLRSLLSLGLAIARLPASVAIPAHLLRVRDRFTDQMRIGHVDDGELGQVAGGRDLDGPDPEETIDEALHDVHPSGCAGAIPRCGSCSGFPSRRGDRFR